ncbi:DUF3551 domain-containing protein [Bradyrhizobium manausense]|uniref:DUF3551 domain-containing protein n=1 Tax=Bradyrhizobium TaxID=374 RepID=UPI001BA77094|nr:MULTISPECIES: DUF3551 domain-containing protein [Bradyrhizobium]MBR0829565.1 DUF3551 domain-containing protein [Bradyrhizobium manausense]UVO25935.1 DUF3551 domain-containing protein [Bradyrhizobium arachidis]
MRTLPMVLPVIAMTMVITPASAQRYDSASPVCMQKWEWGGGSAIYCGFATWEQCKAAASGLSAMCLVNPYWSQGYPRDRTALPGASRQSWAR